MQRKRAKVSISVACCSLVVIASASSSFASISSFGTTVDDARDLRFGLHRAQVGDGGFGGGGGGGGGSGEGGGGSSEEGTSTSATPALGSEEASPAATQAIAADIEGGGNFCDQLQNVYLIDCLAKSLEDTAKKLPTTGDYADTRKILLDSSRKLERIVGNSRDRQEPTITVTSQQTAKKRELSRVRAIRTSELKSANAQALKVLEEAETKLLRSSGSSKKANAYQRIAAAVGSNKVLLRAA